MLTSLCLAALVASSAVEPDRLKRADVPAPLMSWIDWVLHGQREQLCPLLEGHDDATRICQWPATRPLALSGKGGTFVQRWRVLGDSACAEIPRAPKAGPDVGTVDGRPAPA